MKNGYTSTILKTQLKHLLPKSGKCTVKIKGSQSEGKVMAIVLGDVNGLLLTDFLEDKSNVYLLRKGVEKTS